MAVGIERKSSIGYGVEVTEGTHVAATASEMFLASEITIEGINPEMIDRIYMDDTFGERYPVPSVRKIAANFMSPVRYNGNTSTTVRTAPEIGELLKTIMGTEDLTDSGALTIDTSTTTQLDLETGGDDDFTQYHACGVVNASSEVEMAWITAISSDSLTISPGLSAAPSTDTQVYASAMYKQASSGHQSLSFDFYDADIIKHALSGCKGNATISIKNTETPTISSAFKGISLVSSNDTNGPAFTPTYDTTVERAVKQARIFIDGTQVVCDGVDIDLGVEVTERPDANGDEGLKGLVVTNQQPTITMTGIEAENITNLSNLANSTSSEITIQIGTELGNNFGVYIPRCYWIAAPLSTSDGKRIYELQGKAIKDSGNDAIYLAYM